MNEPNDELEIVKTVESVEYIVVTMRSDYAKRLRDQVATLDTNSDLVEAFFEQISSALRNNKRSRTRPTTQE